MYNHRDSDGFKTADDIYGVLDTDYRGNTDDNISDSIEDASQEADGRKRRKKKKKRRKKHYLLRIVVFILLIVGIYVFMMSSFFAISEIRVENNSLISDEEIIELSGVKAGDNMFKSTRKKALSGLKENSYIADVRIKRQLPDIYIMSVQERIPIIAIEYGGRYVILDEQGCAVDNEETNMSATIVTGVDIKSYETGQIPEFDDSAKFNEVRDFIIDVNDTGMYFKKVEITESFSMKCYVTDTLICSGVGEDIVDNMEAIKVVLYDLDQKGIKRGVIKVGEDGYASFSPITE